MSRYLDALTASLRGGGFCNTDRIQNVTGSNFHSGGRSCKCVAPIAHSNANKENSSVSYIGDQLSVCQNDLPLSFRRQCAIVRDKDERDVIGCVQGFHQFEDVLAVF